MSREARSAEAPLRKLDEHRRTFAGTELRVASEGKAPKLAGYAAKFDSLSLPLGGGMFREKIAPGFFKPALDRGDDVRLLINHGGLPLARTTNGTLKLWEDSTGLAFEATLNPDDPDAQLVVPKVKRGDLSQMSFSFTVAKGGDSYESSGGQTIRTLKKIESLSDIALVTYPAYENSTVHTRELEMAARKARLAEIGARIERDERRAQLERLRRSWSAPGPVYTPLSADLVELDRRRRALADRAARDPAMAYRTMQANARAIRQKAEVGALPAGSFRGPDGFWRAPE